MVFFNWATMQMAAKIVYYGPGLCGKTSNLSYIYAKTAPGSRGEMVSLETESDRTLFFDLLPIEVGTIGGFKTRLQLYTVPGQVFYNTTRKLVLKGVDGLVFVADSQRPMREANIESFASLQANVQELGIELRDMPLVLQYNKRDLSNILSIEELNSDLNADGGCPFFEASAVNGEGVITTLKEITKLTLKKLRTRMTASEAGPRTGGPIPASAVRQVKPPQPSSTISARSLAKAAEEGVDDEAAIEAPADSGSPGSVKHTANDATEAVGASEPPADEVQEPSAALPAAAPDDVAPAGGDDPVSDAGDDDGVRPVDIATVPPARKEPESATPPVRRVQVSSHMDILAELDGLRQQATMKGRGRAFEAHNRELDLDSLLSGGSTGVRELRERLEKAVNSDIFKRMSNLQVAIRIQGEDGTTIYAIDPVSVSVDGAEDLRKLCLRFSLDLENLR